MMKRPAKNEELVRRLVLAVTAMLGSSACTMDEGGGPLAPRTVTAGPQGTLAAIVVSDLLIVDLGTLPGGATSRATDINEQGEIVGSSDTASGETHAFLLDDSGMIDLGVLPGGDDSRASAINELGQVVGSSSISDEARHAFIWESGTMTDLGAYPPEDDIGSSSGATGINNLGLISGFVDLAGVIWDLDGTPACCLCPRWCSPHRERSPRA